MQLHYENLSRTSNGVVLDVGAMHGPFKVRYKVVGDAYVHQSYAKAEVWSEADLRWNEVATYHPQQWWESGLHVCDDVRVRDTVSEAMVELEGRVTATLGWTSEGQPA